MKFSVHADKGLRGFGFDRVRDEGLGFSVALCKGRIPSVISTYPFLVSFTKGRHIGNICLGERPRL